MARRLYRSEKHFWSFLSGLSPVKGATAETHFVRRAALSRGVLHSL
jgi:hypothetical protein